MSEDMTCLTTLGVHDLTGIALGTLRGWRAKGKGPASFKREGVVLYRRSVVLAWLAEGEQAEAASSARPASQVGGNG